MGNSLPKLAPPGAGLPPVEQWIGRYLILPFHQLRYYCWDSARQFMLDTLLMFEKTAASCSAIDTERPVLIERLTGLEDSSRYWSVAQVVDHLVIVDTGIALAMPRLASGESEFQLVSTADVKPPNGITMVEANAALAFAKHQLLEMTTQPIQASSTLSHPWFGPLTAKEWLVMAGIHHNVHCQQLLAILKQLR